MVVQAVIAQRDASWCNARIQENFAGLARISGQTIGHGAESRSGVSRLYSRFSLSRRRRVRPRSCPSAAGESVGHLGQRLINFDAVVSLTIRHEGVHLLDNRRPSSERSPRRPSAFDRLQQPLRSTCCCAGARAAWSPSPVVRVLEASAQSDLAVCQPGGRPPGCWPDAGTLPSGYAEQLRRPGYPISPCLPPSPEECCSLKCCAMATSSRSRPAAWITNAAVWPQP